MEGLELQCFQIISAVGMARSSYIEAIQEAKKGNFEEAKNMIAEGEKSFLQGCMRSDAALWAADRALFRRSSGS